MQKRTETVTLVTIGVAFLLAFSTQAQTRGSRNVQAGSLMNRGRGVQVGGGGGAAVSDVGVKLKMPMVKGLRSGTPEYNAGNVSLPGPISTKRREWLLFDVEYQTSARWTDSLAFTYHLLTQGRNEETHQQEFSYYTVTVRYIDIASGKHRSCVCLPPSLLERYGEPVALGLEVLDKSGQPAAVESAKGGLKLPDEWWKNDKVMSSTKPAVIRRSGLVDRSKTPFALINANDYEVVQ
ncbi:MAG: hypothetical protein J5985_00735 [Kiritimatiellae bacterium]|nr:hypothetical protein [Kiritimatiellia bacterium]